MKITRENYELYALDYIEDNLGAVEKEIFKQFLDKNPDLRSEIEVFQMFRIPVDEAVKFQDHSRLLKPNRMYSGSLLLWRSVAAVAAFSLLLLLGKALYLKPDSRETIMTVTSTEEQKAIPSTPLLETEKKQLQKVQSSDETPAKTQTDAPVHDHAVAAKLIEIRRHQKIDTRVESDASEETLTPINSDRPVEAPLALLPVAPVGYILLDSKYEENIDDHLVVYQTLERSVNGRQWLRRFAEKSILPPFVFDLGKENIKEALVPQYLVTD